MSDWFDARVVSVSPAADGLVHVRLEVPPPVAASHTSAGQYVKLAIPDIGESYFAIASGPHPAGGRLDLLLKLGGALTDAIAGRAPGDVIRTTTAQGKGFPLDRAVGRDLVLVATGSGISPVRSAIEAILPRRADFGIVSLYFGARTPSSFAFREELDAWRAASIDVFPVVSRPQDTGWTGLTGYVQSHLGGVHLSTALAFLCGQKGMVEAVRKALTEKGMPADAIFLNY
jgi:NAD(P)H-flavin reductase